MNPFIAGLIIGFVVGLFAGFALFFFCRSAADRQALEDFLEDKDPADWWKEGANNDSQS